MRLFYLCIPYHAKGQVSLLYNLKKEDLRHVIHICGTGTHCLGYIYKQRLNDTNKEKTINSL